MFFPPKRQPIDMGCLIFGKKYYYYFHKLITVLSGVFFTRSQLNIANPATGTQKKVEIDNNDKLCAPAPLPPFLASSGC